MIRMIMKVWLTKIKRQITSLFYYYILIESFENYVVEPTWIIIEDSWGLSGDIFIDSVSVFEIK